MPTTIRLQKKNHKIKVQHYSPNINIKTLKPKISLKHVGKPGAKGDKGDPGIGIPVGGSTGDILTKASSTDYELVWAQPLAFSDKTFVANFAVTDTVAVNHNLNKYPAVSVMDSAGEEVYGEVDYVDTNSLIVRFVYPFSGRITCN